VPGLLVSDKQRIRSSESDAAKSGLGGIVVRWDGRVSQEAAEGSVVSKEVSNCLRHSRERVDPLVATEWTLRPQRDSQHYCVLSKWPKLGGVSLVLVA
jgi:hypothetical protein